MAAGSDDLGTLQERLAYRFSDSTLLSEALTHTSAPSKESNERLEFLGDRILGLIVAEALVSRFPEASEGELATRYNALVRRDTCTEIAKRLDLGAFLRMARSEALAGGRRKSALLGNAVEAIVAAIYLDGGLDEARTFVLTNWRDRMEAQQDAPVDPKTALQEWAQARGQALPLYELTDRSGPDHQPEFTIRVQLSQGDAAEATGNSKRAAERLAASRLLKQLGADS